LSKISFGFYNPELFCIIHSKKKKNINKIKGILVFKKSMKMSQKESWRCWKKPPSPNRPKKLFTQKIVVLDFLLEIGSLDDFSMQILF